MESVLDKPIVLSLNANWMPLGWKSVRQAISAMNSTKDGEDMAAVGVDLVRAPDAEGNYDFSKDPDDYRMCSWEEWLKLPIRDYDLTITTSRELIRVPTVVIAKNYRLMPKKSPKLSNKAIFDRDGGICQYTGQKLVRGVNASVDHIIPKKVWRDLGLPGSPNVWENMALAEAELNHRKGHKLNEDLGLTLQRTPTIPPVQTMAAMITDTRQLDQIPFLVQNWKSYMFATFTDEDVDKN